MLCPCNSVQILKMPQTLRSSLMVKVEDASYVEGIYHPESFRQSVRRVLESFTDHKHLCKGFPKIRTRRKCFTRSQSVEDSEEADMVELSNVASNRP